MNAPPRSPGVVDAASTTVVGCCGLVIYSGVVPMVDIRPGGSIKKGGRQLRA